MWDVDILLAFQFPVVSVLISVVFDDKLCVNDYFAIVSVKLCNDDSGPQLCMFVLAKELFFFSLTGALCSLQYHQANLMTGGWPVYVQ